MHPTPQLSGGDFWTQCLGQAPSGAASALLGRPLAQGRGGQAVIYRLNRRRMERCLWQAFKGTWAEQEPGCLNFSKTSLWIVCGRSQLRWWLWGVVGFGSGGSGQSQLSLQVGLHPLVYLLSPCSLYFPGHRWRWPETENALDVWVSASAST